MPYIGNKPEVGNFRKCDAITTSATATYNLLVGGVAVNPNQNQCIVSLNGVIQSSGNSYTIASSQITFASALTSSDVIDFILILGDTLDVGTVSDDTIGLAQLSATGTPSSSNYLRGDNSWQTVSAGTSLSGSTDNQVTTVTGANAIQGETNFIYNGTIVGCGADGSNADLGSGIHIKKADSGASALADANALVIESDADTGLSILQHTGGNGTIAFGDSGDNNIGMLQYYHGSVNCFAITANATESVRIKDDRVGIGTGANVDDARLHIETPDQQCLKLQRPGTSNSGHCVIVNDNGTVGEISSNGSTTTYATSSDYRLKENVNYTFDATTRLKQLKPARFNWIADDTNTLLDGFLAHEVSSIVPEAVNKSKDATKTLTKVVLDANGKVLNNKISEDEWKEEKEKGTYPANSTWQSSKSVPDYQTIDESKLVPLLVKTIQELEARIKTLEDA